MYQAVNGVLEDYDTIADLLESVEHFLNRLEIYTKIPPTLSVPEISVTEINMAEISMADISEMIVKILVEVLSILALATKQLQQGTLSEYVLSEILYYLTMLRRSSCEEEAPRWKRHKGGTSEVGSTH